MLRGCAFRRTRTVFWISAPWPPPTSSRPSCWSGPRPPQTSPALVWPTPRRTSWGRRSRTPCCANSSAGSTPPWSRVPRPPRDRGGGVDSSTAAATAYLLHRASTPRRLGGRRRNGSPPRRRRRRGRARADGADPAAARGRRSSGVLPATSRSCAAPSDRRAYDGPCVGTRQKELRAELSPARRRARRPVPPDRPAHRGAAGPVLASPRQGPRRYVALRHRQRRRPRRGSCSRRQPGRRPCTTDGCCGCSTPTAPTRWCSSSTSGGRATPSTSCFRGRGPAVPAAGRLAQSPGGVGDRGGPRRASPAASCRRAILVDHAGAVRLIGFAVDAALFGLGRPASGTSPTSVPCSTALTGRVAPVPRASQVPAAPVVSRPGAAPTAGAARASRPLDLLRRGRQSLRRARRPPAQVRPRHRRSIADTSRPSWATRPAWPPPRPAAGHRDTTRRSLPALPRPAAAPQAAPPPVPRRPRASPNPSPHRTPGGRPRYPGGVGDHRAGPTGHRPRRGCRSSTTTATTSRGSPPAPGTPPPPTTTRRAALFAPSRPGPAADHATRSPPGNGRQCDLLAWDTGAGQHRHRVDLRGRQARPREDPVPGRRWLRLAAAVAGCLLLLLAIVVAYSLGRGRTPLALPGLDDNGSSASASPTARAVAQVVTSTTADDLDPQGSRRSTGTPSSRPSRSTTKPGTAWSTMTDQNFGPGGLKTGVGLVVDLGARTT